MDEVVHPRWKASRLSNGQTQLCRYNRLNNGRPVYEVIGVFHKLDGAAAAIKDLIGRGMETRHPYNPNDTIDEEIFFGEDGERVDA